MGHVTSVAFSQDSKHIISGSLDQTIQIRDALAESTSIKMVWGSKCITGTSVQVTFSQDSKHIVSGSFDQTILVWDAETGEVVVGPLRGH
jgi:WD40 repeat protein